LLASGVVGKRNVLGSSDRGDEPIAVDHPPWGLVIENGDTSAGLSHLGGELLGATGSVTTAAVPEEHTVDESALTAGGLEHPKVVGGMWVFQAKHFVVGADHAHHYVGDHPVEPHRSTVAVAARPRP